MELPDNNFPLVLKFTVLCVSYTHTHTHTHTPQLEIARKCGADVVLNPTKCDLSAEVGRLTEGYGCDVYIEATGHPQSVKQG